MAHYDGPPFLKGEAEPVAPKYPLPPKPKRQTPAPKPHIDESTPTPSHETEIGRHSVDPMAAFNTPKSLVHRAPKRPQINYQLILSDLAKPDDAIYLFTDDDPDAEVFDSAPVAQPAPAEDLDAKRQAADDQGAEAVPEADQAEVDAQPAPAEAEDFVAGDPQTEPNQTVTSVRSTPEADQDATAVEAPTPEPMDDDANEASEPVPAPSTPSKATEPKPQPGSQPDASPSSPVKSAGTKLIPSQVDPLKQAQQAQLEAALAKQKKTVYANWRPLQLPKRNDLHSAVGDYKAKHKDLPKPIAEMRAQQADAKAALAMRAQATRQPVDQTVQPVQTPKPASQPDALKPTVAPTTTAPEKPESPYVFPPLDLLPEPVITDSVEQADWVEAQSQRLDDTLQAFHVGAKVVAHTIGPTVTQFQVSLDAGVKVNKITNLNDDLKLALAAKDIRIEAPIPGKTTVGIEIPNLHPRPVMLREVLQSPAFQDAESPLTIALGVDLFGKPVVTNINKMPHGLIAGATGSGKSVFINSLLTSLLYKATPEQVRLLLIDPKAVELAVYNNLPHLVSPVISDPKAASEALKWAVEEMENRYQKMAAAGVRNLAQFNRKAKAHGDFGLVLPYVVIIIDELADLMMVAASEVQDYIARITQKARAAGIHLIVATQRPSVDVITGTIKNNIPTRIAFMVASQTDSRTIIDANGAERLLGRGDMLYLGSGASQAIRLQGTFIDEDIATVVDFVKKERPAQYLFKPDGLLAQAEAVDSQDELFPQVLEYIAQEKHVSTSKLQRVFSIGYNRAANLIDELEMRHYISPANGSKPRDVYFTKDDLADD